MLRLIAALFLPISVCCSSQRLYQHPRTGLAVFNTETPELSHDLFSTRGKEENDPQCMILRGGAVEKRGSTEPNAVTLVHDTKRNNPHCQKSHYTGSTATRMPTFFGSRDSALDRYAACLAATEGLRRHRDAQIELVSVDQRRRRLGSRKSARRIILQAKNKAAANYFRDSTKVIQSMGMLVSEFNDIGQTLQRDASLKEKVLEQAYLYRIGACIRADQMPVSRHVVKASSDSALSKSKVEAFSRTMTAVEALRSVQVERLLTSMQINRLPSGISDPNMLPLLNPTVRTAVEAFSLQAKEIVEAHGLDTMEFNDMLAKVESDSSFRRTVQQHASVMNRSI